MGEVTSFMILFFWGELRLLGFGGDGVIGFIRSPKIFFATRGWFFMFGGGPRIPLDRVIIMVIFGGLGLDSSLGDMIQFFSSIKACSLDLGKGGPRIA